MDCKPFFARGVLAQLHPIAPPLVMKRKPASRPGNFIAAWRSHRGMTQEQLAEAAGTSAATISRLEAGRVGYSKSMLENIGFALNAEPWQLLGQAPDNPHPIWEKLKNATPEQIEQVEAVADVILKYSAQLQINRP
jgi:transcriptional regulator with XRE-family HTH domain